MIGECPGSRRKPKRGMTEVSSPDYGGPISYYGMCHVCGKRPLKLDDKLRLPKHLYKGDN